MMVTGVQIWAAIGYSEGAPIVPCPGDPPAGVLAASQLDLSIKLSKSKMFQDLRLPIEYWKVQDSEYIGVSVVYDDNETRPIDTDVIYGYIDNITELSGDPDNPLVTVSWHVDSWRTYADRLSYSIHPVLRSTLSGSEQERPQTYPFRYYKHGGTCSLQPDNERYGGPWWVYITFSEQTGEKTAIVTGCFPVQPSQPVQADPVMVGTYPALTYQDMVTGTWDEKLGLNPMNIYGVFACSVPPMRFTSQTFQLSKPWFAKGYGSCGLWVPSADMELNTLEAYRELRVQVAPPRMKAETTDTQTCYVLGYSKETIGAIPWGMGPIQSATLRAVVDPTAAYVQVRLFTKADPDYDNYSGSDGLKFNVPMLALPVGSNSTSEYVYGGARDRMAESMQIQTESDLVHGLVNVGQNAIGGAVVGALGGPAGAAIGAVVGMATGVIGSAAGAGYDTAVKNKNIMAMEDAAHAAQPDPLAIPGGGYQFMRAHAFATIELALTVMDDTSAKARAFDLEHYGAHVCRPEKYNELSHILTSGGAFQGKVVGVSRRVIISGAPPCRARVPNEAVNQIVERIESGIRVIKE